MDVLNPEIEIIDGIPYRVNQSDDFNALKNAETTPYIEFGEENEIECGGDIGGEDDDIHVEFLPDGYCFLQLHVPKEYYSIIIGQKGATRNRLEQETKTEIDIPGFTEKGDIHIRGKGCVEVLAARRRIMSLVATARARTPFNHFISIPMTDPQIVKNFINFKEKVLSACGKYCGISENLFQNPAKLHLTIGILLLADSDEKEIAYNTMIACKQDIVNSIFHGHALKVRVRGLEIMNDDPSEVRVLYGKIEDPTGHNLLQEMVNRIVDYFADAGVLKKDKDTVKLHMTLMSSVFASKKMHGINSHASRGSKKLYFNASKIIELFKDYDFGEMIVDKIHLSQNHTTHRETGYWCSSCQLTLY